MHRLSRWLAPLVVITNVLAFSPAAAAAGEAGGAAGAADQDTAVGADTHTGMPRVMWFRSSDTAINGRLNAAPQARRMGAHVAFGQGSVELRGAIDLDIPVVITSIKAHVGFHFTLGVPEGKINSVAADFPVRAMDVSVGNQGAGGGGGDLGIGDTEIKHLVLEALVAMAMQIPDVTRTAAIQYVRASSTLHVTLHGSPVRGYQHSKVVRTEVTPSQGMVELLVW